MQIISCFISQLLLNSGPVFFFFFFFFGCIGVYCVVPFKVINSFFVGKVSFIGIVIVGSMTVIMFWGGAE